MAEKFPALEPVPDGDGKVAEAIQPDPAGSVDYRLLETNLEALESIMREARAACLEAIPFLQYPGSGLAVRINTQEKLRGIEDPLEFFLEIGKYMDLQILLGEHFSDFERYKRLREESRPIESRLKEKKEIKPEDEARAKQEALALLSQYDKRLKWRAIHFWNSLSRTGKYAIDEEALWQEARMAFFKAARKQFILGSTVNINPCLQMVDWRMIDALRKNSPQTRREVWYIEIMATLRAQYGTEPTPELYARAVGISVEEAASRMKSYGKRPVLDILHLNEIEDMEHPHERYLEDIKTEDPEARVIRLEQSAQLQEIIKDAGLSEREMKIFGLWERGEKFDDIASEMGVSAPRISQLFSRIKEKIAASAGVPMEQIEEVFFLDHMAIMDDVLGIVEAGAGKVLDLLGDILPHVRLQGRFDYVVDISKQQGAIQRAIQKLIDTGHAIEKIKSGRKVGLRLVVSGETDGENGE